MAVAAAMADDRSRTDLSPFAHGSTLPLPRAGFYFRALRFEGESDASLSVQDLLDAIGAQLPQLRVDLRPDDSGRREAALLQLDSTQAMRRLGWRPQWENEMLERTIAWYRAFYERGRVISGEQLDAYEAASG